MTFYQGKQMKHFVLGTDGHVDHGKSALIKALTGIDTNRLKREALENLFLARKPSFWIMMTQLLFWPTLFISSKSLLSKTFPPHSKRKNVSNFDENIKMLVTYKVWNLGIAAIISHFARGKSYRTITQNKYYVNLLCA
jgi:hypothetical protein